MNIQLSFRDMSFYFGIPYDLYDQDPEKWNKIIKILLHCQPNGRLIGTSVGMQFNDHDHIRDLVLECRGFHGISGFPLSNYHNSDKNVIISYSGGSGGNFLSNCLYFNDSSSYTTALFFTTSKCTDISVSTLDNIEEKLNYIISETEDQSIWTDPIIKLNCKVQDHKFVISTAHWGGMEETLLNGLRVYPNCKTIIYYKNTSFFKYLREYKNYSCWSDSPYDTICKQTILQFIKKSEETKIKLINLFVDEDQVYSHCYIDSKITCYVWDTNWYFSEKDTITHIKELYEMLQLSGFDENSISKYYNTWIKTMSDLKTKSLNEVT